MHNCKATRERITETLMDEANGPPDEELSVQLRECAECREEFAALKETLRITTRLMETAVPGKAYWTGYHARLKRKLIGAHVPRVDPGWSQLDRDVNGPSWLKRFFTSSVPVPVPLGIALLFVFGLSLLFAIRAAQQKTSSPQTPTIVRVPVEVPIIREKTVTRVLYRQGDPRSVSRGSHRRIVRPGGDASVARSQKPGNALDPVSLIGFKPLEEIKLTVIKGGSPNEK